MTDELKRAIIKLKDRISESVHFHEDLNEASWCRQTGILITRNEANLIVTELEKPLPTDEQIETYALEYILDGVGIQSMINTKAWIAGATWMRDEIRGSLVVRRSEQLSCPRCRHTGIDTDKDGLNYCRGCSHYWRAT